MRFVHVSIPGVEVSIPDDDNLMRHPGMISPEERSFLYNLTKYKWTASGVIVDAGIFLGASTRCFYRGIVDSGLAFSRMGEMEKPIKSYDKAVATHTWEKQRNRKEHINLDIKMVEVGESFKEELERFTEDMSSLVEINIGNITNIKSFNYKIEFLFLDILKTRVLMNHCASLFYPKLIVGGYLIQQDYNISSMPELIVFQEYFGINFEHVGSIRSSAAFKLIKPIEESKIAEFFDAPPSPQEQYALHARAELHPNSDFRKLLLRCSRCRLMLKFNDREKARELISSSRKEFNHILDQKTAGKVGFKHVMKAVSEIRNIENEINSLKT